jgi:hypothetical protein
VAARRGRLRRDDRARVVQHRARCAGRLLATDDETAASATPSVDTNATIDRLREKYLDDAVDEAEFERRLERAMRDDDGGPDRDVAAEPDRDASAGTDREREMRDERHSGR